MMRFDGQNPDEIALKLAHIAWEAGRVLRGMESALIDKRIKDDGTPTTAADLAAEELIVQRLSEAWLRRSGGRGGNLQLGRRRTITFSWSIPSTAPATSSTAPVSTASTSP